MSHHRFQLPRTDGSWLSNPPAETWTGLFEANHELLSHASFDCQGRSLIELRQITQRHAGRLAAMYTSQLLGQDVPAVKAQRWIVTGHQPELFHPGVWAKNFAVHRLARQTGAVGLNLIVDQDTHAGTSLAVPAGDHQSPSLSSVEFDEPRPTCPWEELPLANRSVFESFATRVADAMRHWGISPLLTEAWPGARQFVRRTDRPRVCDCLTAMRAMVERRWHAGNLELPLSSLSAAPGFYWFMAHLLAHLPRFLPLHNSIVAEYRRRHRLRSRTHPVPDLAVQDGWLESPFWVWRAGDHHRDRLFARQVGEELWLRDSRETLVRLPLTPERSACCAVEQLASLPARGIRLRSRALTTTLFARLFLADLFVHGIGGAKYDEMTDELIAKFYRLPAPAYATISATVHLPLGGGFPVDVQDLGHTAHQLWELDHSPERFLSRPDAESELLIQEKFRLIAEQRAWRTSAGAQRISSERERGRARHHRLREINRQLQLGVHFARNEVLARRQRLRSQLKANRILRSRDFAWVLFPEQRLQDFLETIPLRPRR